METLKSYNPASGEYIGEVRKTKLSEIESIVQKSQEAQINWADLTIDDRIKIIDKASKKVIKNKDKISGLLHREMGKSLRSAESEVLSCSYSIHTAQLVKNAIAPQVRSGHGIETIVNYTPLGVCAIISPWNYPVSMAHWMIIPALTAGNSVILKPSEETPLVAQAYVDALNEELPPNVLQIVQGGDEQGNELVVSDGVDFIGFTGSREVGKKIMSNAAGTLKRVILELGGKDSLIVLKDADIEQAARFAIANSLENAGQMCISTERIFVDATIADDFKRQLINYIQHYNRGANSDQPVIGPVINANQRKRILNQIQDALSKGANIIYRGAVYPEQYISPMIIDNITDEMQIAKEETFGPIVCLSTFDNVEDAINSTNSTGFGLGGVVYGHKDAEKVALQLQVGMIGINGGAGGIGDTPWVGAKQSGYGYHGSPDGHRQFTQVQVITKR